MADPEYFTTAAVQALPGCSGFTEAEVLEAAAYFVDIVEREVGTPFVPRSYTETLRGDGCTQLVLSQIYVRSLTSVTVGGVTVDVSTLDATHGVLRYATATSWGMTPWQWGVAVVVVYSAGAYATCPDDIKDAVLWATRDRLLGQSDASGIDSRKTSMTNDLGGTTTYLLAGEKRPTGYPDLDAVIASYVRNTASFGFA